MKDSNGMWLKSYTVGGLNRKTRSGTLWGNLQLRTSGKHPDKCYDEAVNGFRGFQEFAEWCQNEPGHMTKDLDGKFWQLDKDLLGDGKVYSSFTCCFIPGKLNTILIKRPNQSGFLSGVVQDLSNSVKFVARGREFSGKMVHIGSFDTEREAHEASIAHKRAVIQKVITEMTLPHKVVLGLTDKYLGGTSNGSEGSCTTNCGTLVSS